MAYRRQPYGGWGNVSSGRNNDDDYAAPNGRAPRFDARHPWERNKAAISQDDVDVDGGVGNRDHNNYGQKKNIEEPTPAAAAAPQTTDKYTDSYRTAYNKPGNSSGRNDGYADPYDRGAAATRFEARQPQNRPWERNNAASHEVNNKGDGDDDEEEKKKGEPAITHHKPQPYAASAASAHPTKNHVGAGAGAGAGYGTASNKHAYNYNRCEDDMNVVGSRQNRWAANRRGGGGAGVLNEHPVGYGQKVKNNAGDQDGEEEELRRDFANRFTLSPRREHVIPKKQGEASGGGHGQPNVVVVKELKLYLENNKFENFAFKKTERNRHKKQDN